MDKHSKTDILATFFNPTNEDISMADFNQILTPGDVDAGIINVVNEIPEGSCHKNRMEP